MYQRMLQKDHVYCGLNICAPLPPRHHLPKSLCWNPNPQGDGIRRWGFRDHENGTQKRLQGALSPLCPVRTQQEDCYLWTEVSPDTEFTGISILDFVASELWDKHFLDVSSATQSLAICYSGSHYDMVLGRRLDQIISEVQSRSQRACLSSAFIDTLLL